ncbi:TPA: AP2/ERF family transcription factor [Citrobacter amalonaticus]|nr:AP2/ERF family transcription factor [Citrobacter amalonaticus]
MLTTTNKEKFGRLTFIKPLTSPDGKSKKALFRCDCGTEKEINVCNVKSGKTKSCGCLWREKMEGAPQKRHGLSHTREYSSWYSMMQRCYNPKANKYELYGGRGISVCQRWHDIAEFCKDMGNRPEGATLDRIDPDKNYEPGNCRWADIHTQNRHLRKKRGSVSEYIGVELHHSGKWSARIRINDKRVWLGTYDTEEQAAAAREGARIIRDLLEVSK